jgi:hypothetical protein
MFQSLYPPPLSGVDMTSDMTVHCIYTHSQFLEQSVLVREQTNRNSEWSQVSVITQSMLINLNSLGC